MDVLCARCGESYEVAKENTWWDFKGAGYDTRLARCPLCGSVNIIEYYEEPDRTAWYYDYRRQYYDD